MTAEVRIKDLGQVGGQREQELIGYGLVTGLEATGDKSGSLPTAQSLSIMLKKLGVSVPAAALNVSNVAAVVVTARVPVFSPVGTQLDADVSSIANAESLEGGTLLLTPLKGSDGRVYATAQGKIRIPPPLGDEANKRTKISATVGRIVEGVILERTLRAPLFDENQTVLIQLDHPDFVTAERVVDAIKVAFDTTVGAQDPAHIRVQIPPEFEKDPIGFLARLESLTVEPDTTAKVVINEQTGTVISGKEVRISPVTISHGQLKIKVKGSRGVSLPGEATVTTLVSLLSTAGANPWDIATVFKTLKRLGALKAELVVM